MSDFQENQGGCFLLFANAYSMQMQIFIHIKHETANIICYKGHTVSLFDCFLGFVEFKGIAHIYMAWSIRDKQTLNCNGWMFDILVWLSLLLSF